MVFKNRGIECLPAALRPRGVRAELAALVLRVRRRADPERGHATDVRRDRTDRERLLAQRLLDFLARGEADRLRHRDVTATSSRDTSPRGGEKGGQERPIVCGTEM